MAIVTQRKKKLILLREELATRWCNSRKPNPEKLMGLGQGHIARERQNQDFSSDVTPRPVLCQDHQCSLVSLEAHGCVNGHS